MSAPSEVTARNRPESTARSVRAPIRLDQAVTEHAVGEDEVLEGVDIKRGLDDAATALVNITEHDQIIGTGSRERANFRRVIRATVFMRSVDNDRTAEFLESRREGFRQAATVIVVV